MHSPVFTISVKREPKIFGGLLKLHVSPIVIGLN